MGDVESNQQKCTYCKKFFKSTKTLHTHMRKFHTDICLNNQQIYKCKKCNKNYKYYSSLLTHNYIHNSTVKFLCKEAGCEKVFKSPKRLSEHHQRNHILNSSFMCEYCGYTTAIRSNLMVHRRLHTDQRPYNCKYCEKCFNTSSGLMQHHAAHTEKRSFKCNVCGLAFFTRLVLKHHSAVHSLQKQFKCKYCERLFTQAAGRSQHTRWHLNQLKRVTNLVT